MTDLQFQCNCFIWLFTIKGSTMRKHSVPELTIFRFGYAVGLLRGAERISESKDPIVIVGLPAYLLIGFSIENALASYLIAHEHDHPGDYKSHDLSRAMKSCIPYGLVFGRDETGFIDYLTPLQKDFVFRYPERLESIIPPDLKSACQKTKQILRDVDIALRMKGINVTHLAEQL